MDDLRINRIRPRPPPSQGVLRSKQLALCRAETILEVLIATAVLALTLVLAGQLRLTAIRHTQDSRLALAAEELANEGIEALRAIVATNRLRFAARLDACWDALPNPALPLQNCHLPASKIAAGSYLLSRNLGTRQWQLLPAPATTLAQAAAPQNPWPNPLDCDNTQNTIERYRLRIDQAVNAARGESENPNCQYPAVQPAQQPHTGLFFTPQDPPLPPGATDDRRQGKASPFFRTLEISRNADPQAAQASLKVTSRVIYFLGNERREVVSSHILFKKPLQ